MATKHAFWSTLFLGGAFCLGCRADTIYLTNGTEVNGTVVEDNGTTVVVKTEAGGTRSYRKSDVDAIVYERKSAPAAKAGPKAAARPYEKDPAAPSKGKPDVDPKADAKDDSAKTGAKDKAVNTDAKDDAKDEAADAGDKKKDGEKDAAKTTAEGGEKDKWSPPPGLPGFPKGATRMDEAKEKQFMALVKEMESPEMTARNAARAEVQSLGSGVLPYVASVIQHSNVDARTEFLYLVAQLNGRPAIKQVIEALYATVPADGDIPRFQELYLRAFKSVLPSLTQQDYLPNGEIQNEPVAVREALDKYIAWYDENYDRLPKQLGEAEVEPTDPDYAAKLKEARKLNLAKKTWLRPPTPEEITATKVNENRPAATEQTVLPPERQYIQRNTPDATARNDKMLEKFKARDPVQEQPRERKVDRK